ncbi:hypothetical protein D915_003787 [Fasciola hepatica]|uniref:DUF4139 domain-containing protein n=1 Tax=Fasciola hepatica TaxID=6192 RepID=A0A4E0RCH9_FASHE|nr:hypothetical protein D915_003787 [Fasciola hepatica]
MLSSKRLTSRSSGLLTTVAMLEETEAKVDGICDPLCARLASPEPSEHQSVDFDGPMNIFYSSDCNLRSVTAYISSAVICRSVKPHIRKNCTSLLVFKRLPASVDGSSFRVEIHDPDETVEEDRVNGSVGQKDRPVRFRLDGTRGCAYIQDVNFHTAQPSENERELTERQNMLLQQLAKAQRKCHTLYTRFQRLSTQQNVLESFANSLLHRPLSQFSHEESECESQSERHSRNAGRTKRLPWVTRSLSRRRKAVEKNRCIQTLNGLKPYQMQATGADSLQLTHIEAMRNFFSLYNAQTQQLDEDAARVSEELDQCRAELEVLEGQLRQLNRCQDEFVSKELHVLIESRGTESPQLELSYSVGGVSWTPAYDIRLSSTAATLQVIYYGLVSQSTGENWELGKLTLSTAQPTEGGGVPELKLERIALNEAESWQDNSRRRGSTDRSRRNLKARSFHAEEIYSNQLPPIAEMERCRVDEPSLINSCRGTFNANSYTGDLGSSLYLTREGKQWSISTPVRSRQSSGFKFNPGASTEQEIISGIEWSRNQTLLRHNFHPEQTKMTTPAEDSSSFPIPLFPPERCPADRPLDPFVWFTSGSSRSVARSRTIPSNDSLFQSLTFEVEHPPSLIRGTGEPHRVTLGVLEFRPSLEYVTIPKLLPKAFLRARMHNTSEFALLKGLASVYIDNCFNGKTHIPATVVQEELVCNLGVDSGVHIAYKPRHKYKKTASYIGGKTISITFTQVICLTNTYPRSLCILVIDQLPVCTEDKVKVQLLEPMIKHPEKYDASKPVRINKLKMVEWDVKLGPYESRELILKYLVEYPITKDMKIAPMTQS